MLQSRVIFEVPFTFVSIREFMVVNRACFQIQGFIFWLRLYFKWDIPISGFATMTSRANKIRSRCATTWLPTSPSGSYPAAPLPSSSESGLTSHCESDKLSFISLVRMTLTRNNHCERGFRQLFPYLSVIYWWYHIPALGLWAQALPFHCVLDSIIYLPRVLKPDSARR